MHKSWALILILFCSLKAESILDKIGWQGASLSVIVIILSIFLIILTFLILYNFRQHLVHKHRSQKHAENVFLETAKQCDLSNLEVDKLKQLTRHEKMVEPQVIFQSISMYEKCVNKEVNKLLTNNISSDLKKEENEILRNIRKKVGFHRLAFEHPLVSSRNISIGQAGSVFGRNHKKPLINRAVVIDSNEFTFILRYNVEKEEVFSISPGDEIRYAFSRQNDSVYGIPLRVQSAEGDGTIEVVHTTNLRRNQLRQYVRIEIGLPIKFRLIKTLDKGTSDIPYNKLVETKMSDISGGGISFICENSLRAGDLVSLSFNLPENRFTGISGKVLRISLQEGKTKRYFKHHVQFNNLEPRKRDLIVKYVFEKQRQINQWR